MPLAPGTSIGPFQVLSLLGAGGMGEVYRARDDRLARDVAVKLLPAAWSQHEEWLRRFESEARAAGGINHPNIVHVFDVGAHEGRPYVVSELLEGDTLRGRLANGALPPRKALDAARQLAEGLAAAHDAGIVHRDLKPENVFLTPDGRVKILDFGLAKLERDEDADAGGEGSAAGSAATEPLAPETQPGVVLGTAGYMAPEQVRGQPVDARADLFCAGAIFYELFTGKRAFLGPSTVETMNAILTGEPPAPSSVKPGLPPAVDRLILRCLEKAPSQRFQNAHDLAYALDALSDEGSSPARSAPMAPVGASPRGGRGQGRVVAVGALVVAVVAAGAFLLGRMGRTGTTAATPPVTQDPSATTPAPAAAPASPTWTRLTFRAHKLSSVRATHDGRALYFSEKGSDAIWVAEAPGYEPRAIHRGGDARVLSVSRKGELLVMLWKYENDDLSPGGTLARLPASGGAPREVLENVHDADFGPDGQLAVVVRDGAKERVEWPIGTRRFETTGSVTHLRISPSGDAIAFIHHPAHADDRGEIHVIEAAGPAHKPTRMWGTAWGLAWAPSGELWYTASDTGSLRALHGIARDGSERVIYTAPVALTLVDVSDDGRAIVTQGTIRRMVRVAAPGAAKERELSWLDWSVLTDLSADGRVLTLVEAGDATGGAYRTYVRPSDGRDAVLIGEGLGSALSPDGRTVVMTRFDKPESLELVPVGAGAARTLPPGPLRVRSGVSWFPDSKRVIYMARAAEGPAEVYTQDVIGGDPVRLLAGGGVAAPVVSPDGKVVALRTADGVGLVSATGDSPVRPARGVEADELLAAFAADGRLVVYNPGGVPCRVMRVDPTTGRRELLREIPVPGDMSGIGAMFHVTPDASAYAYEERREIEDAYAADGLR